MLRAILQSGPLEWLIKLTETEYTEIEAWLNDYLLNIHLNPDIGIIWNGFSKKFRQRIISNAYRN